MTANKKRRGSFLKVRKGRGRGATWYIVDTYANRDEVLHEVNSKEEAERKLKDLRTEQSYRDFVEPSPSL